MLLVIDAGNTNVTFGVVLDGAVVASHRAATRAAATADETELLIDGLLALDGHALAEIDSIALASVVPSVSEAIAAVAERHACTLLVASPETVPIPVRVDRPAEVGADRLVNALAVQRLYGTPAVVVDFGTATTFDAVAQDGAYVGGAIAPGLEIGLDALAARTARLPRIELRAPDRAIGTDTVSAMRSGAVHGYIGLTKEILQRVRDELAAAEGVEPSLVRTVATGGLVHEPWLDALPGIEAVDPDLTLKGLAILHEETAWGSAETAGGTTRRSSSVRAAVGRGR